MVIDDDAALLASTQSLLERDGHEVIAATDPAAGIEMVRAHRPHLLLLDYVMPRMSGADVVRAIRAFDDTVQVLLVTGYAEDQPGRELLQRLDIQDFHDKGDGPDRLMVQVEAALKHYRVVEKLRRQERRLVRMVEAGPKISRLQPIDSLFRTALENLVAVVGAGRDASVATSTDGLLVMRTTGESISIRAGTGKFSSCSSLSQLPPAASRAVRDALESSNSTSQFGPFSAVSLKTRDGTRGCMIVEITDDMAEFAHLIEIFALQVAQAIENVLLYEQATHDTLTGLNNRGVGLQTLEENLRLSTHTENSTSVVLVDVDNFKQVNDTYGHAAGDVALCHVAASLKETVRSTDVVSRHGGEEFLIVLPATDIVGATAVAEDVRRSIAALEFRFDGKQIPLTISAGVAAWSPTTEVTLDAAGLLHEADRRLYHAKATGRDRVCAAPSIRAVS